MDYDLELDRVVSTIKAKNAKMVCVQLPDGLKPKAGDITNHIRENTDAQVIIWAGSCYGACDIPLGLESVGVDLLVQWGHAQWT
jgi:2-(3-amino-3-carboxypropyl)histidine synthase